MRYKIIFWDIDNTLYDVDRNESVGISPEVMEELLLGERTLFSLTEEERSDLVPYDGLAKLMQDIPRANQGVITNGGQQHQEDKLRALGLFDLVNPKLIFTSYGEIEKILKDPKHPLYPTGPVNGKRELFRDIRKHTGKPKPYMFERAIQRSGSNVNECIMIGDNWKDIAGAQSIGMDSILMCKDDQLIYNPWTKQKIQPTYRIKRGDVQGLREILKK